MEFQYKELVASEIIGPYGGKEGSWEFLVRGINTRILFNDRGVVVVAWEQRMGLFNR
jgi:hypothetical protein